MARRPAKRKRERKHGLTVSALFKNSSLHTHKGLISVLPIAAKSIIHSTTMTSTIHEARFAFNDELEVQ